MPFADAYTFRARILPALVVVLPLGFAMFALLPGHYFFMAAFVGFLTTTGGTAVVAQLGRDRGRKKEPGLWESWGGKPTTRLLRHRTPPDERISHNLRQQVENWTGCRLPTEREEGADPEWADMKYEDVVTSLREATRDRARFPLVFAENVNYGFRRNLWGMKSIGAIIASVVASFSWASFSFTVWGRPWPDPWWDILVNPDSTATIRLVVAIASIIFATFWLFWVKPSWVKVVADAYAIRLMEAVQTLRSG